MKPTADERFWSKVDKTGHCWMWTGAKSPQGYGHFCLRLPGRRFQLAHRISFFLATGEDPGALCVLHSCDNPGCVNPGHLWIGTRVDNNADREKKGRGADHKGERHGAAKLTDAAVLAIRARRGDGTPQRLIAAEFGVSQQLVSRVTAGDGWRHIHTV